MPEAGDDRDEPATPAAVRVRVAGLLVGLVAFVSVLVLPTPEGLSPEGSRVLAVAALMAAWWMTEALPLGVTALVPLVAFPALSVLTPAAVAPSYADPVVFLFLGGFLLAQAFRRWGLHQRVALRLLLLVGTRPRRLVLAFMVATATISMWVSNTATAIMLLPIGAAVAGGTTRAARNDDDRTGSLLDRYRMGFPAVLMLAIAYSAGIGGMATLIGTPPNALFAGQSELLLPDRPPVGFLTWMLIGLPAAAVLLALTWLFLAFVLLRDDDVSPGAGGAAAETLAARMRALGPRSCAERTVAAVFAVTVAAWVTKSDLVVGSLTVPGWADALGVRVHDGTIAVAAAVLLFVIPVDLRKGEFVLDWAWAQRIQWQVLLLFGGGFALAAGLSATGVERWIASSLAPLGSLPLPVVILTLCVCVVVTGELVSNTAQIAVLLPVLAATAEAWRIDPYWLMVPATLAASCGFVLPVATPPNAVAVASGHVAARDMARAGLPLDLLGALIVTAAVLLLGPAVLGLSLP